MGIERVAASRSGRVAIGSSVATSLVLALAGLGQVGLAQDDGSPLTVAESGDLGSYLTGTNDMTLYFFTKDAAPGASVCDGDCATNWPPYLVKDVAAIDAGDGVTGVIGTFERKGGNMQVAYDGRPLYYFAKDEKAGDTKGQGIGHVWFVAAVDGSIPIEDSRPADEPAAPQVRTRFGVYSYEGSGGGCKRPTRERSSRTMTRPRISLLPAPAPGPASAPAR